jgi:hypothetical protein
MSDEITVPLGLLRRYLAFRGWRRPDRVATEGVALAGGAYADVFFRERSAGQRNADLYVLSEDGLEDIELVVPHALGSGEATRRLEGAIETLSQLEGRDRVQIVADVRGIGFDVVKTRIPDELVYEDTIHLDQAVNYTAGVKKLLAASATTEMIPDVYFLRVKKEASQYAEQCRFGHTFKGSFGFTIESPVAPNIDPVFPGMEQAPPFERRVIQRLANGIRVVQEAVRAEDPTVMVSGFQSGFSANMCEDFAELIEQTSPAGMAFGFAFSPEWPTALISELRVGPLHVEMSRLAAKRMREQPISTLLEISGRVTRLQNEADPTDLLDDTHEREIIVHWKSEEYGGMNIKMFLAPDEYLVAVDAHMKGQSISVKGKLEKRGRRWVLIEPTSFSGPSTGQSIVIASSSVMADDKSKTRPQDALRVNVHEAYEVEYWTKKFGCTADQLRAAVQRVGVMAADVETELKRR